MDKNVEIVVIGGGPGGLACAKTLAQNGREVVLIERKKDIGPKVCAGGITWGGLLQHVPASLVEQGFTEQHIFSHIQHITVAEQQPIIATVNRRKLGQWMAAEAAKAGVAILTDTKVTAIDNGLLTLKNADNSVATLGYDHLVGADGSNSVVRRFLNLGTQKIGIGLNCMVPLKRNIMEWHLNTKTFGTGYGWIFPHKNEISIGVYGDQNNLSARKLKERLIAWAAGMKISVPPSQIQAGLVNYDYRGVQFEQAWLVGDAAGLASGLTGEGIFPAIVSGQAVAKKILNPGYPLLEVEMMAAKQQKHNKIIALANKNRQLCKGLMELMVFLLRVNIINFKKLEMAE